MRERRRHGLVARRERHRRRQPARHVGGEARARQDRRQRAAARSRAITSVMNLCVPRSMPLAQAITGVPAASSGAITVRGLAQVLRRHRQQDGVVAPDLRAQRRDADALVEPHAGQARALAPAHDAIRRRRGRGWRAAPRGRRARSRSPARSPRRLLRRRRCARMSSCASAVLRRCDLRQAGGDDVEDRHVGRDRLACGGPVTSASGQRACGAASSVSVRPSASRSAPAQAIMAPLSVHSSGGGTTSTVPASNAIWCSTLRIASLAATPPAATSAVGLP